jgi:hypothetical protein
MQDPGYGHPRIPLLGRWVNKGKKEGRSCYAPALKSVVRRDDHDRKHLFVVCQKCWLPIREDVWLVPGFVSVTGKCDACLSYVSVVELAVRRALVKEIHRGTCRMCAGEERVGS